MLFLSFSSQFSSACTVKMQMKTGLKWKEHTGKKEWSEYATIAEHKFYVWPNPLHWCVHWSLMVFWKKNTAFIESPDDLFLLESASQTAAVNCVLIAKRGSLIRTSGGRERRTRQMARKIIIAGYEVWETMPQCSLLSRDGTLTEWHGWNWYCLWQY